MILRNGRVQVKKLKKVFKKTLKVSIKNFCRKWEEETLPK